MKVCGHKKWFNMLKNERMDRTDNLASSRVLPFAIITLASLFYVYEFMLRVMPSAMKFDLMHDLGITASGFGVIGSLFYWGYNPIQIPAGLLYDRYSTRILMAITVFICGLGAFLFGATNNFYIILLGRFLIGVGSAFAFIGALVLAARWFEAKYFALITGVVQFMGSMGAIIGVYPIAIILKHFSWRSTQMVAGLFGIVLAVLFLLIIRDRPEQPINETHDNIINKNLTEKERLSKVLSNPQTWWVGVFAFASWAPMTIFPAWWGIVYLSKYYSIPVEEAGQAIMFIWLGNAIASPLIGWWSNRINNRRIPLIVSSMLALITSLLMIYAPNIPWVDMCIITTLFGASASAQTITFGLVQDNMPPEVAGTAVGFNNMAVVMGGAIFTPLVGFLLDFVWDGKMVANLQFYKLSDYQLALILLPICSIIGLITAIFFIKETHCQAQYSLNFNTKNASPIINRAH